MTAAVSPGDFSWIHPDQAKARKAIPVPLSNAAVVTLRKQVGKHPVRVFTYNGNPVIQVNTKTWHKSLKRLGIENFRWHDLRHTWASWHIQEGTPLHVLQELGLVNTGDDGAEVRTLAWCGIITKL